MFHGHLVGEGKVFCCHWVECSIYVNQIIWSIELFDFFVLLLIVCLVALSVAEREMVKYPL